MFFCQIFWSVWYQQFRIVCSGFSTIMSAFSSNYALTGGKSQRLWASAAWTGISSRQSTKDHTTRWTGEFQSKWLDFHHTVLVISGIRLVEPELFPCLRKFGISFYGYNPRAFISQVGLFWVQCDEHRKIVGGGFFTGRYTDMTSDAAPGSRFDPERMQGYVSLSNLLSKIATSLTGPVTALSRSVRT